MQIATYVDGRSLDYDEASQQFSIGGTPVTKEAVLGYDRAAQLAWVSVDMRSWFHQSAEPSATAVESAEPTKKRRTGLIVLVVVGALVALCGICGVIGVLSPDSSKESPSTSTGNAPVSPEEQAELEPQEPTAPEEAAPEEPAAPKVGQTVKTDKFEITVTSVETKDKVGGEFFEAKPAEGGEYVVVEWKYKNVSKEPVGMFSKPSLKLVNPDDVTFEADLNATASYATEAKLSEKVVSDLNPGITVKAAEVFEVEKGSFDKATWMALIKADDDVSVSLQ